ncbi:hypothetical protein RDI58_028720 [Solanum bulbocastanum]|uniref:Uncharacterized protein n=1 Tax=Solanum bulbocastanum TaxID=147425 RepID=A0AAN8ST93_SOLBU
MAVVEVKNFGGSSSSSSFDLDSPVSSVSLSISPPVNLSSKNSQPKSPELLAVRTAPLPQFPSLSSSPLENFVSILVINGNLFQHLRLVHHPRRDIQAEVLTHHPKFPMFGMVIRPGVVLSFIRQLALVVDPMGGDHGLAYFAHSNLSHEVPFGIGKFGSKKKFLDKKTLEECNFGAHVPSSKCNILFTQLL